MGDQGCRASTMPDPNSPSQGPDGGHHSPGKALQLVTGHAAVALDPNHAQEIATKNMVQVSAGLDSAGVITQTAQDVYGWPQTPIH